MGRQLEYDTGPDPDGDEETPTDEDGRREFVDAPWKAGLAAGTVAFVAAYAIAYQLASTMLAWGTIGPPEVEPGRRALAGLLLLGGHGARIEENGEPIAMNLGLGGGFLMHLSALVPVVVLVGAGYLLVRYLAEGDVAETIETAARAGGISVAGYLALAILLATVTSWTQEPDTGGVGAGTAEQEVTTTAVAVDSAFVITVAGTAVAFLALGGLLALVATYGLADDRGGEAGNGGSDPDDENGGRGGENGAPGDDRETKADENDTSGDETATDRPSGTGHHSPRRSVDPDRRYGDSRNGR